MSGLTRRHFLAAAAVGSLAGCADTGGTGGASSATDSGSNGATQGESTGDGTAGDGTAEPTILTVPTREDALPLPMAPAELRSEARSGGPAKDGIPSIDDPSFVTAEEVDFLQLGDPVFGVARDGVVKAYPQSILVQHEIVNDTLAGEPVAVTYCPLTGTVQGFERGDTTFGVSGRLVNNNLVMYDRATETWWPQIPATSIPGPWSENPPTESLREFRLVWTTWKKWRDQYPETEVLSTETGYVRNYDRDPYGSYNSKSGYYANENTLFPTLNDDDRFPRKRVVMGARTADGAVAFEKSAILSQGTMQGELGETPVLAVADPRFDTAYVYLNPDEQSFEFDDGSLVAGGGDSFEPDELPLTRVHTFDAMWFAWSGYYPDTNVYA